eukprot:scaffold330543_cov41-Prasinocladus_malaysianus.AAC.1
MLGPVDCRGKHATGGSLVQWPSSWRALGGLSIAWCYEVRRDCAWWCIGGWARGRQKPDSAGL